jgi:hypothetical protein
MDYLYLPVSLLVTMVMEIHHADANQHLGGWVAGDWWQEFWGLLSFRAQGAPEVLGLDDGVMVLVDEEEMGW